MKINLRKIVALFLFAVVAVFGLTITTVHAAEEAEQYKFTNYVIDFTEGEGTFWYENEDNAFTIDGALFTALVDDRSTFEDVVSLNGAPVWATEDFVITTKKVITLEEGVATVTDGIGHIEGEETVLEQTYSAVKDMIIDSFADAYLFAYDRGGFDLGAPIGLATIVEDEDSALVQEFENGKIVMHNYERPAVPIYGEILEAWEKPVDDGGFGFLSTDGMGSPIARQFTVGDKTYQNFEYGYAEVTDGVAVARFSDSAVDYNGNLTNRFVGFFENRANVTIGNAEFGHELLRMHESYMTAYSNATASGFTLYRGGIREGHEWNGNGVTQGYGAGDSTANPWGQASFSIIIMESPFHEAQVVRNSILDQYATKGNDQPGNIGFPTTPDYVVEQTLQHDDQEVKLNVTFQNFDGGYIRSYLVGFNVHTEEFVGHYVNEEGIAFNSETNEEVQHEYDLTGLETDPNPDPDPDPNPDPNPNPDPEPTPEEDETSLVWLWITIGVVVVAVAGAGVFFFLKKRP